MQIVVMYSPAPRQVREWTRELPVGTTIGKALAESGLLDAFPELDLNALAIGVWGRRTSPGRALKDGDRVEIYRGLRVDPKVARRERFARQGAKGTGLFASTRAGAKAGY